MRNIWRSTKQRRYIPAVVRDLPTTPELLRDFKKDTCRCIFHHIHDDGFEFGLQRDIKASRGRHYEVSVEAFMLRFKVQSYSVSGIQVNRIFRVQTEEVEGTCI